MKLNGQSILPPQPIRIVIPREVGDPILLYAGPVLNFDKFRELVPMPKAPLVMRPGKGSYHDYESQVYKDREKRYGEQKMNYLIIKSLAYTEGLEWETVNLQDPETWDNYRTEMALVFTESEIDHITVKVMEANFPTEERQREALERFTARQAAEESSSSQTEEQTTTPSSESVNVSG